MPILRGTRGGTKGAICPTLKVVSSPDSHQDSRVAPTQQLSKLPYLVAVLKLAQCMNTVESVYKESIYKEEQEKHVHHTPKSNK